MTGLDAGSLDLYKSYGNFSFQISGDTITRFFD